MRKVIIAIFIAASTTAFAAPKNLDKLSTAEVHELELIAMKQQELQKAIDAFKAEASEVDSRLRKEHHMTNEDGFDVQRASVARGALKKQVPPHAEKTEAVKASPSK